MATIKAVVVPAKALKDGRHKVRLSIAHNGEVRYIITDIVVDSVKEFKGGMVVKRQDASMLNTRLRGEMQRCQSAVDSLEYTEGLTCSELVALIKQGQRCSNRTLSSVYDEYVEYARIKDSTKNQYAVSFCAIEKLLGKTVLMEHISHSTVLSLDKRMRAKRLKGATIRDRLALLRTLVLYAKRCGYAEYKVDPFLGYKLPGGEIRQSWLTVEEVRLVRDADIKSKSVSKCRDLFMLSYYLGGINMADIMKMDFGKLDGTIKYERTKTDAKSKVNKYVEFDIPDEAKEIIERLKGKDGHIAMTEGQRKNYARTFVAYNCKRLGKLLGLPNLIYYSARKSFAQHAFSLGVDTSTIDYILGHSLGSARSSIYSYIKVTPEMATEAIKKVLENLK